MILNSFFLFAMLLPLYTLAPALSARVIIPVSTISLRRHGIMANITLPRLSYDSFMMVCGTKWTQRLNGLLVFAGCLGMVPTSIPSKCAKPMATLLCSVL